MPVEIVVVEQTPKINREYPYFGKSKKTDKVILFTGKCRGIVVSKDSLRDNILDYRDSWVESNFTPINYSITIFSK